MFLYSCIVYENLILTEAQTSNLSSLSASVQECIKYANSSEIGQKAVKFCALNIDFYISFYHCYHFIVATEQKNAFSVSARYLESLQQIFTKQKIEQCPKTTKFCLNQYFKSELQACMSRFNSKKHWTGVQDDGLGQMRNQVNEVTGIMRQNIESVIQRGDNLDDMVDRAYDLQATADVFHTQSSSINRTLYWRNMRQKICIIGTFLIILTIMIIWFTIKHRSKPDVDPTKPPKTKH